MSFSVALTAGLASALAYGVGTAGQHAAAYCGDVSAKRLVDLLRSPRWLLSGVADVAGIVLQIVALANGPVVLVQPLLVLSLPVAVLVGPWFGLARPSRRDLGNCGLLIAGLTLFFLLLGSPHRVHPAAGHTIGSHPAAWTSVIVLVGGLAAILATRHRAPVPRAVVFGMVAGTWFGVVSVLVEAVSRIWEHDGLSGFARAHGLVPLLGLIVLAVGGYLLVQIGFQLGPLGASFPANLVLDPVVAVILGVALLHERLPLDAARIVGYLIAVALIAWAAVKLADPKPLSVQRPLATAGGANL